MTTYPAPSTLSGQKVTVDWLTNNPRFVDRTLRTLVQQRLVGDRILTGTLDLTGSGTAIYGIAESIFAQRSPEVIPPMSEYPLTDDDPGTPAIAVTSKYGLRTEWPQELVARNRLDIVQRKMIKLANRIAFDFDALVLSAVSSAVTQTQAASAAWNTSTADPFLDVMLSGAVVDTLNQGYVVDTVLLSPTYFARLVSASKVIDRASYAGSDLLMTGRMVQIAGVTFLKTTNLPPGVNVMVLDSTQLGTIATERLGGPGWNGDPTTVETNLQPDEDVDGWCLKARKVAVPMVQEPGAAVKITGV